MCFIMESNLERIIYLPVIRRLNETSTGRVDKCC